MSPDSIAQGSGAAVNSIATTPPIKKNPPAESPQNHRRTETLHGEGKGLTMAELVAKIGKTRQAIESARDKGTLGEFGFHAEKNGRNWVYYPR